MVRILHAPRWALAAVIGTFAVAVAILVTGLSASASPGNGAPPQVAASAGDNNGPNGDGRDGHDGDGHDGDGHDGDNKTKKTTKTETKTQTETKTSTTATTKTSTATETTTGTSTAVAPTATATELAQTGSSSSSPLILIGSAMLLAGGIGTVALRRWRDVADRRG